MVGIRKYNFGPMCNKQMGEISKSNTKVRTLGMKFIKHNHIKEMPYTKKIT